MNNWSFWAKQSERKTQIGFVLLNWVDKSLTRRKPWCFKQSRPLCESYRNTLVPKKACAKRNVTSFRLCVQIQIDFNYVLSPNWFFFHFPSQQWIKMCFVFLCIWNPLAYSFLQLSLNYLLHGKPNIYTSALACLTLKAYSLCRANEWKSFRQNTSSIWWVPGHFAQVEPPFQDMGDGGTQRSALGAWGRSRALLTLLSLWKEAICAFGVGPNPKRLGRGGLDCRARELRAKMTTVWSAERTFTITKQSGFTVFTFRVKVWGKNFHPFRKGMSVETCVFRLGFQSC